MVTIEFIMLVALGFSLAGLLACVLAPMYRRRTARLATDALKRAMPLTASEIAADKDRIRAEYAIRIHKLESSLSDASLETARQLVDINRRDARISALESDVARLGTINEEHENARRVLEMTITERLPKVEQRLSEAKRLLFERDREIGALTQAAQRQSSALEEATQINTQQREELNRLNATLATRAARLRELPKDQQHEAEIALRTEIEALRARVRDQAQMITRLQTPTPASVTVTAADAEDSSEMARLRSSLSEAEKALQDARANASSNRGEPNADAPSADVAALEATIAAQTQEIASLKAALDDLKTTAVERPLTVGELSGEDRHGLQTRLRELESQTGEQMETILALRAELAAGNEKLERQATFYMDEMRRLGAGTRPAGSLASTVETPPPSGTFAQPAQQARPSLSDRISAPRVATVQIATPAHEAGNADHANGHQDAAKSPAEPAGDAARGDGKTNDPAPAPRRQSLLQRITGLEKPVA